jgi:hypothetical protein
MAKAKSHKRAGIIDSAIGAVGDAVSSAKKYFSSADEGTLVHKLQNQKQNKDKLIKAATGGNTVKKKPKPTYKAGSNPLIKAGKDKLKSKSKSEIEAIRKKLQSGKKVKAT